MRYKFFSNFFWFWCFIAHELNNDRNIAEDEIEKAEVKIKAKKPKAIYKFSSFTEARYLFFNKIKHL
tara:strand:- start:5724 stop:5924 length:201 start_codon:yes stop_codon:yes gene_type:complete